MERTIKQFKCDAPGCGTTMDLPPGDLREVHRAWIRVAVGFNVRVGITGGLPEKPTFCSCACMAAWGLAEAKNDRRKDLPF